ncbi:MAG: hypothetical protein ACR65X_01755 [Methylocystis sp.]
MVGLLRMLRPFLKQVGQGELLAAYVRLLGVAFPDRKAAGVFIGPVVALSVPSQLGEGLIGGACYLQLPTVIINEQAFRG